MSTNDPAGSAGGAQRFAFLKEVADDNRRLWPLCVEQYDKLAERIEADPDDPQNCDDVETMIASASAIRSILMNGRLSPVRHQL